MALVWQNLNTLVIAGIVIYTIKTQGCMCVYIYIYTSALRLPDRFATKHNHTPTASRLVCGLLVLLTQIIDK